MLSTVFFNNQTKKQKKVKKKTLIRSLANLCSFKVTEILQVQQPIIKPVLDTASIADINNSWAESLMSNSSHSKQTPPGSKKSEWSTYSPPRTDGIKTIGKFERKKIVPLKNI